MILPNCACRPARLMRSCSARATLFSMPEYACTTYQRLVFEPVEVSVVIPDLSAPAQQQVVQEPLEALVDHEQKNRHQDDEPEHDTRRRHRLLAARPHDTLRLLVRLAAVRDE